MDTMGQPQRLLHISADSLETVLELVVAVVLLSAAGVIAAVVLVTAFGHGWDAYVKLKRTILSVFEKYIPVSCQDVSFFGSGWDIKMVRMRGVNK